MVLDKDTRAQFSVLIHSSSLEQGGALRTTLMTAGYEVFVFNDEELVINRTIESAPHLVVFFMSSLQSPLSTFIEKILQANQEIQFIAIGDNGQVAGLMDYREYNLTAFLPIGEALEDRLLWEIDNACTSLYRLYQNEQLLETNAALEEEAKKAASKKPSAPPQSGGGLVALMSAYNQAHSKEEIVDALVEQVGRLSAGPGRKIMGVFFRFLPTVSSFVATHAAGMDVESLRGVGGKLTPPEASQLDSILRMGQIPTALSQLLQGPLAVRAPNMKPLFVHKGVEGIFVFWTADGEELQSAALDEAFLVFALQYQLHHLSRRVDALNVEDPLTGLFNREQYQRRLDEEIARARRLKNAVAVVKVSVDHLTEYEQSMGLSHRDNILRSIALMVRKTSRVNDAACRTNENEISVILPHCPRKGAAIRAERIRRMVEAHEFPGKGVRITVSIGISEYPSLSKSSQDLDRSSQEAMKFISERGGNKVCLFKPPEGFKPDYDVVPV